MKRNLLILAVLLLRTSFTVAQIPQTMSYQGKLTDAAGVAVANGNYSMTFALYDTVVTGVALWTENQASVAVSGGIFSVILGSATPINITFVKPYWLGISVAGGAELSPRTALTSSAYSAISKAVLGNGNVFSSNGNVGIGTTSPSYKLTLKGSGNEVYSVMSEDGTQTPDNLTLQIAPGGGTSTTRIGYLMGNFGNASSGFMIANTRSAPLRFGTGAGPTEVMRIDASGNVGIGTTSPASKLDVAGTVVISGNNTNEVNRAQTGAANLVPIAYGNIGIAGTINSGTGNFTSTWNAIQSWYEITISGESYNFSTYITIVTPIANGYRATTSSVGGALLVLVYTPAGVLAQGGFQFVTFKP